MDGLLRLLQQLQPAAPAPEFCFLGVDRWWTCMTKAEWSGWVQAVGSVGALLGIWWTIRKQRQLAIEAEKRTRRVSTDYAVSRTRAVVGTVSAEVELLKAAFPAPDNARLKIHRSRLEEGVLLAQSVALEHLPLPYQSAVIGIKSTAMVLRDIVDMALESTTDRARFEALARLEAVVNDQLPKVAGFEREASSPY